METNKRKLNDIEKNRIFELCKNDIRIYSYWNKANWLMPICLILVAIFNYKTIVWENIWIFLLFIIFIYIFWNIMAILQFEMFSKIKSGKYECIESKLIRTRELCNSDPSSPAKTFMITVNIDGKDKEVEYKGENFEKLQIEENIVVIHYKNIFKLDTYKGFSYNELNN